MAVPLSSTTLPVRPTGRLADAVPSHASQARTTIYSTRGCRLEPPSRRPPKVVQRAGGVGIHYPLLRVSIRSGSGCRRNAPTVNWDALRLDRRYISQASPFNSINTLNFENPCTSVADVRLVNVDPLGLSGRVKPDPLTVYFTSLSHITSHHFGNGNTPFNPSSTRSVKVSA